MFIYSIGSSKLYHDITKHNKLYTIQIYLNIVSNNAWFSSVTMICVDPFDKYRPFCPIVVSPKQTGVYLAMKTGTAVCYALVLADYCISGLHI